MTAELDVLLCGSQAEERAKQSWEKSLNVTAASAKPPTELSGEELNGLLAEASSAELVAVIDSTATELAEPFRRAIHAFQEQPSLQAALLPFRASEEIALWRTLPARLASFLGPPETDAGVIVRKSALESVGPPADLADPLWDWMIRAATSGAVIQVLETAGTSAPKQETLPDLAPAEPGPEKEWLFLEIDRSKPNDLVPEANSEADVVALKAGLFQLHDYLEESHRLAQECGGRTQNRAGEYWHAIMHRREPDFANSKYWFRRTGRHPVFEELADRAALLFENCDSPEAAAWRSRLGIPQQWDPAAFVEFCQHCLHSGDSALTVAAELIQKQEMYLLLSHTYRDAVA